MVGGGTLAVGKDTGAVNGIAVAVEEAPMLVLAEAVEETWDRNRDEARNNQFTANWVVYVANA